MENLSPLEIMANIDREIGNFSKHLDAEKEVLEYAPFNRVVQMLARGADHYEIMTLLLKTIKTYQEEMEKHMMACPYVEPIVVPLP